MKEAKIENLDQDFIILLEEHLHHLPAQEICYHLIKFLTLLANDTAKSEAEANRTVMGAVKMGINEYLTIQQIN